MTVLVDTSAFYALLDEDDVHHAEAARTWFQLVDDERLVTSNYVVLETSALVQRRLGMAAVEQFHQSLLPVASLVVVDESLHRRAIEKWLARRSRQLSLVDVTSFLTMADQGLSRAFAYDDDFEKAGFSTSFSQ